MKKVLLKKKTSINLVFFISFSIFLTGCLTTPPPRPTIPPVQIDWNNPIESKSRVSYTKTDYGTIYRAPVMIIKYSKMNIQYVNLIKWYDTYKIESVSCYDGEDGWSFYDRAYIYNEKRPNLNFKLISRKVNDCNSEGCQLCEAFAIDLPNDYIEKLSGKNIIVDIDGKNGGTTINIPTGYVTGFLSAIPK